VQITCKIRAYRYLYIHTYVRTYVRTRKYSHTFATLRMPDATRILDTFWCWWHVLLLKCQGSRLENDEDLITIEILKIPKHKIRINFIKLLGILDSIASVSTRSEITNHKFHLCFRWLVPFHAGLVGWDEPLIKTSECRSYIDLNHNHLKPHGMVNYLEYTCMYICIHVYLYIYTYV